MGEIVIKEAPVKYWSYLKSGDKKGNENGKIDNNFEANRAMAKCDKKKGKCEDLEKYLESYKFQLGINKAKKISELRKDLRAAYRIKDVHLRSQALYNIVAEIAKAGFFRNALAVSRTIPKEVYRGFALTDVVSSIEEAGLINKKLFSLLNKTLGVAGTIKYIGTREEILEAILSAANKDKLSKGQLVFLYKRALKLVSKTKDPVNKLRLLTNVASKMAKEGFSKKEVVKVFRRVGYSKYAISLMFEGSDIKFAGGSPSVAPQTIVDLTGSTVDQLLNILKGSDQNKKEEALASLALLISDEDNHYPKEKLIRIVIRHTRDPKLRKSAILALSSIYSSYMYDSSAFLKNMPKTNNKAVAILTSTLRSQDPEMRRGVVYALEYIAGSNIISLSTKIKMVRPLIRATRDLDLWGVANNACAALGALARSVPFYLRARMIPALVRVVKYDNSIGTWANRGHRSPFSSAQYALIQVAESDRRLASRIIRIFTPVMLRSREYNDRQTGLFIFAALSTSKIPLFVKKRMVLILKRARFVQYSEVRRALESIAEHEARLLQDKKSWAKARKYIKQLGSSNKSLRTTAAETLLDFMYEECQEYGKCDFSPEVKGKILTHLLFRLRKDRNPAVRALMADVLEEIAEFNIHIRLKERAVIPLTRALGDRNWQVRSNAAGALAELAGQDISVSLKEAMVDLLIRRARDRDPRVLPNVARALRDLAGSDISQLKRIRITPALINLRRNQTNGIAIEGLNRVRAKLDSDSKLKMIALVLKMQIVDSRVLRAAASFCAQVAKETPEIRAKLIKLCFAKQKVRSWHVRRLARRVLIKIAGLGALSQGQKDGIVNGFIGLLKSGNLYAQNSAASALGNLATVDLKEFCVNSKLRRLLDQDDCRAKSEPADVKAAMISPLMQATRSKHKDVRGTAINSLGSFAKSNVGQSEKNRIITFLIKLSGSANADVREAAVSALGEFLEADIADDKKIMILNCLFSSLSDPSEDVISAVVIVLRNWIIDDGIDKIKLPDGFFDRYIDLLIKLLKCKDESICFVTIEIINALALTREKIPSKISLQSRNKAVIPIIAALSHKDWYVRSQAADAIGELAYAGVSSDLKKKIVSPLIKTLKDKGDEQIRCNAAESLRLLTWDQDISITQKESMVDPLIAATKDKDSDVIAAAKKALKPLLEEDISDSAKIKIRTAIKGV